MASLMSGLSARAAVVAPASRVAMPQSTSAPVRFGFSVEAAHKKGTGSTKNGRDSNPQYLGVKKYGGEPVTTGNIIIRQRGNAVRLTPMTPHGRPPKPRNPVNFGHVLSPAADSDAPDAPDPARTPAEHPLDVVPRTSR